MNDLKVEKKKWEMDGRLSFGIVNGLVMYL